MGGLKQSIYRLGRTATQRWHLLRTMATQLVEHERISTTYHKAKALQPLVNRVVKLAKQSAAKKPNSYNRLCGILTTRLAVKKMTEQIVPRLINQGAQSIRVLSMPKRRLGDNARMGYIEFIGNEIERYETAVEKEQYEKGDKIDLKVFNQRILQEERDFFKFKYDEQVTKTESDRLQLEEKVEKSLMSKKEFDQIIKRNEYSLNFFQRKLEIVEKDLWIENKNKYDLRKYFPIH